MHWKNAVPPMVSGCSIALYSKITDSGYCNLHFTIHFYKEFFQCQIKLLVIVLNRFGNAYCNFSLAFPNESFKIKRIINDA